MFILILVVTCNAKSYLDEMLISIVDQDQNTTFYSQWITRNLPTIPTTSQCIDVTYSNKSDFNNVFIEGLSQNSQLSIRVRTVFDRDIEKFYCDFFILISIDLNSLFNEIKLWSLNKRFKYFLIIVPMKEIMKSEHYYESEIDKIKPHKWKLSGVLTHPNVMLIINRNIYKFSTPFNTNQRKFISSNESELKNWKLIDTVNVTSFNGVHLRMSSTNNPPHHFWVYKNQHGRSANPKLGDFEIACQYKEDQPLFGYKNCCEY